MIVIPSASEFEAYRLFANLLSSGGSEERQRSESKSLVHVGDFVESDVRMRNQEVREALSYIHYEGQLLNASVGTSSTLPWYCKAGKVPLW
jgi:hypothetical protein